MIFPLLIADLNDSNATAVYSYIQYINHLYTCVNELAHWF